MRRFALVLLASPLLAQEAPHPARVSPPAARVSVKQAIEEGVRFLVANQNKDGSFGKSTSGRTWEVSAHVPGGHQAFQAATTALCWMGLQAAKYQPEESGLAQQRALRWLVKHARVKRATPGQLYNTWSFAYGLKALSRALRAKAPGATEAELRKAAKDLIKAMGTYQTPDGGWGYYDFRARAYRPEWSTSFTTATTLVALKEAEIAGLSVPVPMVSKASRNVLRCRKPDGSYLYGMYARYWPQGGVNKPQGSAMRAPACNLALRLCGVETPDKELRRGLDFVVKHHRFAVAGVRRPIPHESWYAVSGYFYLYGHHYAADTLAHLPAGDRARYAPKLIEAVLKTRQPDGSFWDYPLYGYHKFYGTGYALMTLAVLDD